MLGGMSESKLEAALRRSDELDAALWSVFPDPYVPAVSSPRHDASLTAALMAVEHARATRLLISASMSTTAIGVQRMQFEALARSMWLLYAASEDEVGIATAPLTAKAAKKADDDLPMAAEMVKALKGKTPPGADEMMAAYKAATLKPLHSFVHAGFHPLRRHVEGYPEALLLQIVGNCNGLLTMTGAMLAILAGNQAAMGSLSRLQAQFADCLPELLAASPAPQGPSGSATAADISA